ncbi:MAG TPA: hypothetical protein VGL39_26625 [Jatrophihabitantaceae bacterium]|jgi:hypothetical protein
MFIQVIQGKVADEASLRAVMDRWVRDCQPGAVGWLGSTSGITDDGTFVGVVRFESEDAARRNGERPEQDAWWNEAEKCFAGEVTFLDSSDVTTWLAGGSDDAGFVQVIEGHLQDPERMRSMMEQHSDEIRQMRPEIIGATVAVRDGGDYVQTIYFTSEAEARAGEKVEPPQDVAEAMAEEMQDARFFDLRHPMMMSPG